MNRSSLEHLIRAAAEITNEYDLVIIGSQSILGQFPDAPEELDLACSKLVAGRPKDLAYVEVLCRNGMVDQKNFLERLQSMNRDDSAELEAWVSSQFQAPKPTF